MPVPSLVVEITQAHPRLSVDAARLEALLRHVLRAEGHDRAHVGLVLTDHETVLALNRSYLQHDYLTDVLAFRLSGPDEAVEGEVYVDLDTAAERCDEFGVSFAQEAFRYAVHGLLHLLGHDDATPAQKAAMHRLEDRYLAAVA